MKDQVKNILPALEYLNKASPQERQEYITTSKNSFLKKFIDLLFNINCGNLPTTEFFLNKLRKFKKQIIILCKKTISLKVRKAILKKKNLFSKLIPILVSLLINNEIFQ